MTAGNYGEASYSLMPKHKVEVKKKEVNVNFEAKISNISIKNKLFKATCMFTFYFLVLV